ncbi:MAG: hypothetical protein ACREGA_02820 [Candidatus Saccharimonadales bacterium]
MPYEEMPQESKLPAEPNADLQAMLGTEDSVDSGELTPEDLLDDVVNNPHNYHLALRSHIANYLSRRGLGEKLGEYPEVFQPASPTPATSATAETMASPELPSTSSQAPAAEQIPAKSLKEINNILDDPDSTESLTLTDFDKLIDAGRGRYVFENVAKNLDKFQA